MTEHAGVQAEEIRGAVGRDRGQHRAVHRRPHRQRPALPRLRHPRDRHRERVRGDRPPADPREAAQPRRARGLQDRSCARCAGCRPRCAAPLEVLPASSHPMDVLRTGVSVLGCTLPEKDDHDAAGARDIADRLIACLGSMLVYWYHFSHSGQRIEVETNDDSIGGHFLHLLHRPPAVRLLGARHAHLADPVRRARVQRLDLRRARHRRHRLRPVLVHHRRDRRAARTQARRRQRDGAGDPAALRQPGRGGDRHQGARGQQGGDHRLRPPGVHHRRSAQPGDQGGGAAAVAGGRRHEALRRSPSASSR